MKKYSEKFQEALDHLEQAQCDSQKSVSQIIPSISALEVLRLSDSKSIEKQPQQQLNPSPPVLPKQLNEDPWSSSSRREEDPQNQVPIDFDDEFVLHSQRTVVIDQGFDPTKPRFSEQIRIDLDMSSNFPGDSQFDFEINEERTTNSMITPDDSDIYYNDFDANIEKQESSELRKPRK